MLVFLIPKPPVPAVPKETVRESKSGIPAKRKQLRLSGAAVPRNAGSKGRGAAGGIEQGSGTVTD